LAIFERDSVSGIRAVTVSPDGLHVYATGYWDKAIVVFERFSPRIYLPLVLNDFQIEP